MHPLTHSLGLKAFLWTMIASAPVASVEAQTVRARPRVYTGAQVEALLGDRLATVAQGQGMTEGVYREALRRDKSLRGTASGELLYVCPGANAPQAARASVAPGPFPAAQTFALHSRATARRKLYLDFNGHTTSGTSWNSTYMSGANIVTAAYDIDGAPGAFSAAELDRIQLIWQQVAEDFAPFDVDVTTEDPGLEALRRTTSTDTAYGVRMVIGGSSFDWLGAGAGGVAFVGSFNWNSDTPGYVFPAQLGGGDAKFVAEATSHEAGHTLGLNHDGQTNGTEYYDGHGNWAPIMGAGYNRAVVQWSKGEYPLANNPQDDIAVMQTYGAPLRTDDAGSTTTAATNLSGSTFSFPGVIHLRTDVDMFRFTTGDGAVNFAVALADPSPNLDVALSLYNSAGTLLQTADPTGLPGSLSTTLPGGTYFLKLDGVAQGDATTGYNDYGSLGQYTLTGSAVATGNQAPIASLANSAPTSGTAPLVVNFSSTGSYDPDGNIAGYAWDFGDGTAHATTATASHSYTVAGSYTARLTVTDNGGLTTSATTTINVTAPTTASQVYVADITMTKSTDRRGTTVLAKVTVKNASGAVIPGATVSGSWSGLLSANRTSTTSSAGVASFISDRSRSSGTVFFTVTSITGTNLTYNAAQNVETSDSISVP